MRLILSDVRCMRGGRLVLDRIQAVARPGRALVVSGPNGAGKSTLLRLIAGLLPLDGGAVRLEGGEDRPLGEQAHLVGHLNAVKRPLSVRDNLRFWRDLMGVGRDIEESLGALGLAALGDTPAEFLSAGQRRRLALGRLAVVRRPLWLLDEPTTALDRKSEALFAALLADHLAQGGLAVVASHAELPLPADHLQLGAAPVG